MILNKPFFLISFLTALILTTLLSFPSIILAHGVIADQSSEKAYGFQFSYDDGTQMSFAEVKVYGPNDSEKVSQVGRTNLVGTYAFIPPEDGNWLLKADDGQGHLAQIELVVNSAPTPEASSNPSANLSITEVVPQAPPVNVDRIVSSATKPYKMAVVILALIVLGLGWKLFSSPKSAKQEPPKEPANPSL
jgi:nickel transport protein